MLLLVVGSPTVTTFLIRKSQLVHCGVEKSFILSLLSVMPCANCLQVCDNECQSLIFLVRPTDLKIKPASISVSYGQILAFLLKKKNEKGA